MEYKLKVYRDNWKNVYQKFNHDWYKLNRPVVHSSGHMPLCKFPDVRKANGLTRFVIDMINYGGGYANRISSSGRMINAPQKQQSGTVLIVKKFIPGTTRKGTADIHAIIDGKHWSIEIKIGKDRMSEFQHEERQRVMSAGGNYMIVKDAESFCTVMQTMLKPN